MNSALEKNTSFPKKAVPLVIIRKRREQRKAEKALAKQLGVPKGYQPTKYRYTYKGHKRREKFKLGTAKDYPYDWYTGSVDSCHGDSGGPLWRNIKDSAGNIRATQIGTVSRGSGCASFNNPAVFGSVKKSLTGLKKWCNKK